MFTQSKGKWTITVTIWHKKVYWLRFQKLSYQEMKIKMSLFFRLDINKNLEITFVIDVRLLLSSPYLSYYLTGN